MYISIFTIIFRYFLLTGGLGLENTNPNPAPEWLNPKNWDMICRLSEIPKFSSFLKDFKTNIRGWEGVYDSLTPHLEKFPGMFENIEGIGRLCALRCIRPDTVVLAIQKFVLETMGEKYVKPPPFDLQACYTDSSSTVPLVFILSPGSDPMSAILRAADVLHTQVDPISLGKIYIYYFYYLNNYYCLVELLLTLIYKI
jgi:dynein heavy chain